jgi:intein/homing endonuclease
LNTVVCVAGDTLVDCGGYTRRIEDMEADWEEESVTTYDPELQETRSTDLQDFLTPMPDEYGATVHEVETEFGSVVATSDHPFETPTGPVPVENLEAGDVLLRRPIDLPEFEPSADEQIVVTEDDIREAAPEQTYVGHAMRTLDDLVPFDAHSREGVVAARLAGHLFGDGRLDLDGQTGRLFFRAQEDDLEEIQSDLQLLGFDPETPVQKRTSGEIIAADGGTNEISGSGWSMKLGSKPLASFMSALGVPAGDKVTSDRTVPDWIMEGPKAVKRAFLSAYFGAELSTPSYRGHTLFRQRTQSRDAIRRRDRRATHGVRIRRVEHPRQTGQPARRRNGLTADHRRAERGSGRRPIAVRKDRLHIQQGSGRSGATRVRLPLGEGRPRQYRGV